MTSPDADTALPPRELGARAGEYARLFPLRLRDGRFWLIQGQVAGVTAAHVTLEASGVSGAFEGLHHLPLILYMVPVLYAALMFGTEGGVLTAAESGLLSMPNVPLWHSGDWEWVGEAFQVAAVVGVGIVVSWLVEGVARARRQAEGRARQLRAVHAIADTAVHVGTVQELLDGAIKLIEEELPGACVWVRFEGRDASMDQAGASPDPPARLGGVAPPSTGAPLVIPLAVPGGVRGSVGLSQAEHFDLGEVRAFLAAVGHELAVGVGRVRLAEEERAATGGLRASEERYRRLFEEAHDAIVLTDADTVVQAANRAAADLFGRQPEALQGRTLTDLIGSESVQLRDAAGSGSWGFALQRGDDIRQIAASWSAIRLDDRSRGFQVLFRDTTVEHRERASLRQYAREVTRAQEEERKRIARELHDDVAQSLMAIARELKSTLRTSAPEAASALEPITAHAEQVARDVRRVGRNLRPSVLDDLGLLPALETLVADFAARSTTAIELNVEGTAYRLQPDAEIVLYRVAQEALRNVERHAAASRVHIRVSFSNDEIGLAITDDGRGFDPRHVTVTDQGGMGLVGMRERAELINGTFAILSSRGGGTTVEVTLRPVDERESSG